MFLYFEAKGTMCKRRETCVSKWPPFTQKSSKCTVRHLKGICSAEPSSISVVKLDDVDFLFKCQIAHRCFLELLVDTHVKFNIVGLDQFNLKIFLKLC